MSEPQEPAVTSPENQGASIPSESIALWFACLDEKLSGLLLLFQEKIQDDVVKGQLFEKLYQDMSHYRDDFVFTNITKRVLTDIMRLFDWVDGTLKEETLDQIQREEVIEHMRSFRAEILQILRRQEVSLIDSQPGMFNEAFQEARDTRCVQQPEDD